MKNLNFKNNGFSMVGLMAVVAIIGIFAIIAMPLYNQYIESTKVSKEIPVIGTYKNDIAACFMKNDSLENCNDGESGIHSGLDNDGKILSLDVFKGNIVIIIDAKNHIEDVEPIELMFVANPDLNPTLPTLDWTLYCNDYSEENNALVKECKGLITDKDGDGYDDSVEEEWNSDPLDPDSVPVNWEPIDPLYTDWVNVGGRDYTSGWEPETNNQTSDFTQTRSYDQDQTRERTDREQDSFSGDIRVVDVITEEQTITGSESRDVQVTSGNWVDSGSLYACGTWSPSLSGQSSDFTQTRSCSQDQTREYTYSVGGGFTDTQTVNVSQTRNVDVSGTTGGGGGEWSSWSTYSTSCGNWSPARNTVAQGQSFTQSRTCTDSQERFKYYIVNGQVANTERDTRTTTRTETRTSTGTYTAPAQCEYGTNISGYGYFVLEENSTYTYEWRNVGRWGGHRGTSSNPVSYQGYEYWLGALEQDSVGFGGGRTLYEICRRAVNPPDDDNPPLTGIYN